MTISSISNSDYLSSLLGVLDTDQAQSAASSTTSAFGSEADQANISSMGKMMSQLQQLSTSDPTKFKALAQKISDDLSNEAANTTDTQQSKMLSSMSSDFATAAKTGSMDSLKPKGMHKAGVGGGGAMSDAESIISQDMSSYSVSSAATSSNAAIASNANAMNQFMQLLNDLEKSDPAKFKALAQQISDDLAAKAKSDGDQGESSMLSKMSGDFATAAQTGNMSSLRPQGPPPPPPGGFTAASGSTSSSSASSSSTQDPMSILNSILSSDLSGLTATLSNSASA